MSVLNQDQRDRLDALYGVELESSVAERHLLAIEAEIRQPSAVESRRVGRRRAAWVAVLASAVLAFLLPVAGTVASESAVPGDVLYPVKLAAERVVVVVFPDAADRHRIEELEILIDRRAPDDAVRDATDRATDAVSDRSADDPLVRRLDALIARTERRAADDGGVDDEAGERAPDSDDRPDDPERPGEEPASRTPDLPASSTTTAPPDRRGETPTTTSSDPTHGGSGRDSTTTTEASRSDGGESGDDRQDEPPPDRGAERDR